MVPSFFLCLSCLDGIAEKLQPARDSRGLRYVMKQVVRAEGWGGGKNSYP